MYSNTPYKHESSKKLHRREHFQVHQCTHRSVYSTSRRCDKSGNVLDRTSFIPGTTQLDTYWGAMALLRDGVSVEVCPLVMVKVMKAFVRIVVDQDEQVLHLTVRVRQTSSASCGRQSVPHSNTLLNTCSAAK